MAFINLENPPATLEPEVVEYLDRMFRQVSVALNNNSVMPVRTDITSSPKEGRIYYFKNAPPSEALITSAGYWGYVGVSGSGTWVKLG